MNKICNLLLMVILTSKCKPLAITSLLPSSLGCACPFVTILFMALILVITSPQYRNTEQILQDFFTTKFLLTMWLYVDKLGTFIIKTTQIFFIYFSNKCEFFLTFVFSSRRKNVKIIDQLSLDKVV